MVTLHFKGLNKYFLISSTVVLVLDQLLKLIVHSFQPQLSFGFLTIHFVQNTGAGFGILKDHTPWLAIISLIVALAVIYYYPKLPQQQGPQLLWGLFLGGVLGNFLDRIFRGYVTDFLDLKFWPAFNLADAAITLAVIGLIMYEWKK